MREEKPARARSHGLMGDDEIKCGHEGRYRRFFSLESYKTGAQSLRNFIGGLFY